MRITDWPAADRPREKLLEKGEQALTDAELIAIFLQTGTRGKSALDIAKTLLAEHQNLKRLVQTPLESWVNRHGVGRAKYAALRAAVELGRRFLAEPISTGTKMNSSQLTRQFLGERLRHHAIEVFACLFLDTHLRLIAYEELFHGTVNEAMVYPREIVRRGLLNNAAKVILAHNHPSGIANPSEADKDMTQQVCRALALVNIAVVDHIVIGHPGSYSFAEAGLLLI